ncbi:TetR/AcrR family transcriptional regulator [Gordonia sp. TBRC 11910]|uniref:TetR/AcrR family transcriptional regulator n=1 Tax=Gordonia asplenii TaxID=2725283 RepID=A0A848KT42_9ACTN|nr:TetR/AcrR family transcriptional regulator [Gordonia asplenii]NMO01432.1 TetR/AcrR family transcriptional regulator [Gordonia asplenii]
MPTRQREPARTPGRERQRAATIRRATEAAEALLVEGVPFADLSVEQVISRAGIARSTFYAHFDDLGHLLRALGEGVVGDVVDAARLWMGLEDGVSHDKLRAAVEQIIKTYRKRQRLLAALAEASTSDPVVREEFHSMFAAGHAELAKHIERGQAAGFVRPDVDPEPTAGWIVWMVERGLYQQVRVAKPRMVQRNVDALTDIIWQTLYRL